MEDRVTGIEVILPDRSELARGARPGGRKPMASVTLQIEGGGGPRIAVPVRVARLLSEQELSLPREREEVFAAIGALEEKTCFAALTDMISRREHGSAEARGKLRSYGYREQDIDAAIARATELHFLDDARFISNFIEEHKRRGWGRRKIEVELRRRGVAISDIEGYPEAFFSEEEDAERAERALERKAVSGGDAYEKLVRYLMGKGFSYRIASEAAREHLAGAVDGGGELWRE